LSKKELSSAWSVLRFTLRDATKQFSSANATRVGALPADPPDPERVELVVKSVLREIESIGEAGEKSPILRALKTYGMIVADNGSSWFVSGAPDPRWDDAQLEELKRVPGTAFEVVRSGPLTRG